MNNELTINQIKALVHSTYTRDNRINLYDNIENILCISNKIIENPSIVILHRISDKVILSCKHELNLNASSTFSFHFYKEFNKIRSESYEKERNDVL